MVGTLPEAGGFALAGGAALILLGIVDRETTDLDYFAPPPSDVGRLADAIESKLSSEGLTVSRERQSETFARLHVEQGVDMCVVDIAQDARIAPPQAGPTGATVATDELAADKTLAVSGRGLARDFIDVYFLANRYGRNELLALAATKDLGFDRSIFAEACRSVVRFDDAELGRYASRLDEIRAFFLTWREELLSGRA